VERSKIVNSIIDNIKKQFNDEDFKFREKLEKFAMEIQLDLKIQTEKKENHK